MPTGAIRTPNANGTRQPQSFRARLGQRQRQHEADRAAQQAAEVLARELPTRKEHAPISRRGLEQKHGRRPHFAADRESLKQARDNQEDRRQDANRLVAGRERDDAAADRHQPDGEGHRRLAPGAVAVSANEGAAERPRDEADAESGGRRQIAHQDIVRRKERLANHAQECGVDREIEEFETVAEDRRKNTARSERWPREVRAASAPAVKRLSSAPCRNVSGPRVAVNGWSAVGREHTPTEARGSVSRRPLPDSEARRDQKPKNSRRSASS